MMIRRAETRDAEAISRIADSVQGVHVAALPDVFQQVAGPPFPEAEVLRLMAGANGHVWVGVDDEGLVGYLYAEVQVKPATPTKLAETRLYIHQMGVLETDRGMGIGTGLLQAARDFATENGISRLGLDVWTFNRRAQEFYRARGFSVMREELWSVVDEAI